MLKKQKKIKCKKERQSCSPKMMPGSRWSGGIREKR